MFSFRSRKSPKEKIWEAAHDGDVKTITRLLPQATVEDLQYEAEVIHSLWDAWCGSALLVAAYKGHIEIVQMLLQSNKVNINQKDSKHERSALLYASKYGNLPVVEYLVQQGADIHMQDKYGRTALMYASKYGHLPVVQYLVEQCADLNTQDKDGYTALMLMLASDYDHVPLVEYILQHGANIDTKNQDETTALMKASISDHLPVVQYLVEQGANINMQNKYGRAALMFASSNGYLPVVQYLVQQGADINAQDEDEKTALMWASGNGHLSVVQYLVQQGAQINMEDRTGNTALMQVCRSGDFTVAQCLVQLGADIDIQNVYGYTALTQALRNDHITVVQYLVQQGAQVNMQDKYGDTALLEACRTGNLDVVKVLLQAGADKNIQNKKGKTALSVAKTEEIKKIVESSPSTITAVEKNPAAAEGTWYSWLSDTVTTLTTVPAVEADAKTDSAATISRDITPQSSDLNSSVPDFAALNSFLQSFPTSASLQQVMRTVAAHDRTLNLLVSKQKECPSLFWFYPKKPKLRNWLSNPSKCLFQDTLMMVVVCPVTLCTVQCGPDGVGWETNLPKNWVKQWGPAILFSVYVLQAAALAGRVVGIPLPPVPGAKEVKEVLGLTGMLKNGMEDLQSTLCDSLRAFFDVTMETLDQTVELQELCAGLQKGTDQADKALPVDLPMHLVDEAYKSIHTFLTTGENAKLGKLEDQLRGRMERVMAPDGDIEWVSVEGRQAWLDKHLALQTTAALTSSTPVSNVLQLEDQQLFTPDDSASTTKRSGLFQRLFTPSNKNSSWLVQRLHGSGMPAAVIDHCEAVLVQKAGYYTEKAFSKDKRITHQYLEGLGLAPSGVVAHIVTLHNELYDEYMSAHTPPRATNPVSEEEGPAYTKQDKTTILQLQQTVGTLISELDKLRASSAEAQQQQSPTGGPLRGGKGGQVLQQAQCNVTNPRTRQPYTLDELVEKINRLELELADCDDSVAKIQVATELCLEANSISLPAPADKTAKNERERVKSL